MTVICQFMHAGEQAILNAGAAHGQQRNAHVPRQNAHAHRLTDGLPAIAHPQTAARELDACQMPDGITLDDNGIEHYACIFTQANRQIQACQCCG